MVSETDNYNDISFLKGRTVQWVCAYHESEAMVVFPLEVTIDVR